MVSENLKSEKKSKLSCIHSLNLAEVSIKLFAVEYVNYAVRRLKSPKIILSTLFLPHHTVLNYSLLHCISIWRCQFAKFMVKSLLASHSHQTILPHITFLLGVIYIQNGLTCTFYDRWCFKSHHNQSFFTSSRLA